MNLFKFLLIYILVLMIFISTCSNPNSCNKYKGEIYSNNQAKIVDSLFISLDKSREILKLKDIRKSNIETYRLVQGHSLSSEIWIIELKKHESEFKMDIKMFLKSNSTDSIYLKEKNEHNISISDWKHIEYLIYKYNFWTAKPQEFRDVADGGGFVLEGIRPNAKRCNKCSSKIVMRNNPGNDDKIGWLGEDIFYYCFRLKESMD